MDKLLTDMTQAWLNQGKLQQHYRDLQQRYEAVKLLACLSTGALVVVTVGFGIILKGGF